MPVNDVAFETASHEVLLIILIDNVSESTAEFIICGCIENKA